MGIGSILSKVTGFLGGIVPSVMKLGDLLVLIKSVIKVGVAERDVDKLQKVAALGVSLGELVQGLGSEIVEAFEKLGEAVSEDGPGGRDLTGDELLEIADEMEDLGPAGAAIVRETSQLSAELHSLIRKG